MTTERDAAMYHTFDDADTVDMPLEVIALSPESMRQCEAIAQRRPELADNREPARIVGLTGATVIATFKLIRDLAIDQSATALRDIRHLAESTIRTLEGR